MAEKGNVSQSGLKHLFFREFAEWYCKKRKVKCAKPDADDILKEAYCRYFLCSEPGLENIQRIQYKAVVNHLQKEGMIDSFRKRDYLGLFHGLCILPPSVLQKMFQNADTSVYSTALMTLYATGIRGGEVTQIRVRDFDPENLHLTVRNLRDGRSRRVFCPRKLYYRLIRLSNLKEPEEYLFSAAQRKNGKTTRLSETCLRQHFRRWLNDAGLSSARLTMLRDSYAIHLLMNGVAEEFIAGNMGMTLKNFRRRYRRAAAVIIRDAAILPELPGIPG